jgi:hypothetical protein
MLSRRALADMAAWLRETEGAPVGANSDGLAQEEAAVIR